MPKKSNSIFSHFPIKLDSLIMNMTLVFCFGAPGRHEKHFNFPKSYYCTFATSPLTGLVCTGLPGLPEFLSGRPVQRVGWSQRWKNTILETLNNLVWSPVYLEFHSDHEMILFLDFGPLEGIWNLKSWSQIRQSWRTSLICGFYESVFKSSQSGTRYGINMRIAI